MTDRKSSFRLFPRYNELSLFLIAATILALYLIDPKLRAEFQLLTSGQHLNASLPLCLIFVGQGILFTFIHLFTTDYKKRYEKFCMLFFAVFVNVVASGAAGIHFFMQEVHPLFILLPLWNFASAGLLLCTLGLTLISGGDLDRVDASIEDDDATLPQALIGLLILGALIAIMHWGFQLYWALTFSACTAYIGHIDRWLQLRMAGKRGLS